MFDQVVGNGANAFILIIAIIFGFVAALGFIDSRKVKKEQEQGEKKH